MEAATSGKHSSIEFMDLGSLTFIFDLTIPAAFFRNNATNAKILVAPYCISASQQLPR
jgi:hypothetical protein